MREKNNGELITILVLSVFFLLILLITSRAEDNIANTTQNLTNSTDYNYTSNYTNQDNTCDTDYNSSNTTNQTTNQTNNTNEEANDMGEVTLLELKIFGIVYYENISNKLDNIVIKLFNISETTPLATTNSTINGYYELKANVSTNFTNTTENATLRFVLKVENPQYIFNTTLIINANLSEETTLDIEKNISLSLKNTTNSTPQNNTQNNNTITQENKPIIGSNQGVTLKYHESVLDNTTNISGVKRIRAFVNNTLRTIFDFDFNNTLNLSRIIVKTQTNESFGYTIVYGIQTITPKNIIVDKLTNYTTVCIKDAEISSISEITQYCNGSQETVLKCEVLNNTNTSYDDLYENLSSQKNCFIINNTYLITGLQHSGVREGCYANWSCENWSSCSDGQQERTCIDLNNCFNDKTETQSCECNETWDCDSWSSCNNGIQSRDCVDSTGCNSTTKHETRSCECVPDYSDCSDWGPCTNGYQHRSCSDVKGCNSEPKVETRTCNTQTTAASSGMGSSSGQVNLNISKSQNNKTETIGGEPTKEKTPKVLIIGENPFQNETNTKEDTQDKSLSKKNKELSTNKITGFTIFNFKTTKPITLIPLFIILIIIPSLFITSKVRRTRRNVIIIDTRKFGPTRMQLLKKKIRKTKEKIITKIKKVRSAVGKRTHTETRTSETQNIKPTYNALKKDDDKLLKL